MLGIFDSGVGGLTVVKEIKNKIPDQSFIYFGDTARFPWGNKSEKLICRYSAEISNFLISKGVKEVVIACNTASSLAADFLRKRYTRIKFYNVIDPVIERLEKEMHRKDNLKIGIIGTSATIRSKSYENRIRKINPNAIVYSKACPLFAPLVEENWTDNKIAKEIVREYLKDLKKEKIDFLVLGCTHYPLLKKTISEYLGKKIEIISSPEETVRVIKKNSRIPSSETKQRESYCFSDWTEEYHQTVNNILGEEVDSKIIKIVNHF